MTYADALTRFEGDLPLHGPLFEHCPFDIVRNGAHLPLDRTGCREADEQLRPIGVIAALSRLWDPASGQPIGVLTYALDRSNLSIDATPTSRSATVQLNWRVLEWRDGEWTDSTLEVRHSDRQRPEGAAVRVRIPAGDTGHGNLFVDACSAAAR